MPVDRSAGLRTRRGLAAQRFAPGRRPALLTRDEKMRPARLFAAGRRIGGEEKFDAIAHAFEGRHDVLDLATALRVRHARRNDACHAVGRDSARDWQRLIRAKYEIGLAGQRGQHVDLESARSQGIDPGLPLHARELSIDAVKLAALVAHVRVDRVLEIEVFGIGDEHARRHGATREVGELELEVLAAVDGEHGQECTASSPDAFRMQRDGA